MLSKSKIKKLRAGHTVWFVDVAIDECNAKVYVRGVVPIQFSGIRQKESGGWIKSRQYIGSRCLFDFGDNLFGGDVYFSTYRKAQQMASAIEQCNHSAFEIIAKELIYWFDANFIIRPENSYSAAVAADLKKYARSFGATQADIEKLPINLRVAGRYYFSK